MRIGIHVTSTTESARIFAAQLIRALHRRLGSEQHLVAFDGRRNPVSGAEVYADAGFTTLANNARASRVGTCFAGFGAERAKLRYYRDVDVSHAIGGLPSVPGSAMVIPLVSDLVALQAPRQDCERRQLERLMRDLSSYPLITTLSAHTSAAIAACSGLEPGRIRVIRPGVDEMFLRPIQAEDLWELQAIGLLPQQYFLSVGFVDERNNLAPLLEGYSGLPSRVKAWLPLVIVGGRGRGIPRISASAEADFDCGNIRVLGNCPRFMRRLLYQNARLALFPALGGFGLAVIEAVACGARVAVSRDTGLGELAGSLALRANPLDPLEWRQTLADQVDRGSHGPPNAQQPDAESHIHSWDHTAEQALALYAEVMGTRSEAA